MLRSLELASEADDPLIVSWSLTWLGYLAAEDDQRAVAGRYFRQALEVSGGAGLGDSMSEALAGLCRLALLDGDPVGARDLVDRAVRSGPALRRQLPAREPAQASGGDLRPARRPHPGRPRCRHGGRARSRCRRRAPDRRHPRRDRRRARRRRRAFRGDRRRAGARTMAHRCVTTGGTGSSDACALLADDAPVDEAAVVGATAIAGEPTVATNGAQARARQVERRTYVRNRQGSTRAQVRTVLDEVGQLTRNRADRHVRHLPLVGAVLPACQLVARPDAPRAFNVEKDPTFARS